ncbi:hypothetical protein OsJ_01982 [Oryza sativa Japonica Group]|uniref:Uncharacterized protein n=1 Tax=Oryza sativa subsp. japonica TaxID=39947 RepID=A2ZTQ3_ORYSJ|nr:hypothetical protein OsJ_01982 [Oryza sativa Japonica Group]
MANLPRVMGGFSHGDGVASNGTSPVPTITVGLPSCTDQGIGPEWKSALGVAIDCLLPNPARALSCRL